MRMATIARFNSKPYIKWMDRPRPIDLAILLIVGTCLGGFWAWVLLPDPPTDDSTSFAAHEYYPLMVEGWLQGRLDLPLTPAPLFVWPVAGRRHRCSSA